MIDTRFGRIIENIAYARSLAGWLLHEVDRTSLNGAVVQHLFNTLSGVTDEVADYINDGVKSIRNTGHVNADKMLADLKERYRSHDHAE